MNFSIQLEPEVLQEIQEAVSYYEHQQKGLDKRFYDALIFTFRP